MSEHPGSSAGKASSKAAGKRAVLTVALALPAIAYMFGPANWGLLTVLETGVTTAFTGFALVPVYSPLLLAIAAAALAMALARSVLVRRVVALLYAALGAVLAAVCALNVLSPYGLFLREAEKLTGLNGEPAMYAVHTAVTPLAWSGVVAGALCALWGIVCVPLVGRWRAASRFEAASAGGASSAAPARAADEVGPGASSALAAPTSAGHKSVHPQQQEAPREAPGGPAPAAAPDRIDDWDALSHGEDPTADFR